MPDEHSVLAVGTEPLRDLSLVADGHMDLVFQAAWQDHTAVLADAWVHRCAVAHHGYSIASMRRAGPMPEHIAAAVLRRDGDCRAWSLGFATDVRCQGRVHIHHRRLRGQGGPDTEANLMLLCDLHHQYAHNIRRSEAEAAGVICRYIPDTYP